MSTTTTRRRIAADPTSTALLLAGPAAVELWPDTRRTGQQAGRLRVVTELPDGSSEVTVRALPPQRTPVAFVSRFDIAGPDVPAVTATLTLGYASGQHTDARLDLEIGAGGSPLVRQVLPLRAARFLDNLAAAAEERATAA